MTLDEFFAAVEAYWTQADEQEGFRPSPGVLMMLRAIRASQPSVETRPEDKNAANRPYKSGYLPERRLLWIRRAELTRLAKTIGMPDYARDFVNEKDVFIRLTTAFAMSGNIDSPDQRGVVLVGKSDEGKTSKEILWIGITNELDIARLTLEERASRLRSPISRYPARERLGWVRHVDLDNTIPSLGRDALRDVAASVLNAELTPVAGSVDLLSGDNSNDQRVIWYPTSDTDDLRKVLEDKPSVIYVVGPQSFDELCGVITEFLTAHPTVAGNQFVVVDRERLADGLSHQPWLWSTQTGSTRTVEVCKEIDNVKRLLGCEPITEHPVVRRYEFPRSPSLTRVIGRFGSGRTTVLVQLADRLRGHVVLVLKGTLASDDLVIAESLLQALETDVAVLVDDADLYHDELGPQLARLARAARVSRYARRFLVAGSSLSRKSIGQSCEAARRLLNDDLFTINSVSEDAFTAVSIAVQSAAHLNDETVDVLRLFETTPRVVTDWVETHRRRDWSLGEHEPFLASVRARLSRWQSAYEQLPDVSRDILRVIAGLRCLLHWSELPLIRELAADAVAFTTGHLAHESFRAFRELELDGWLIETGKGFRIDDICLLTPINDFLDMKEGWDYMDQPLLDPLVWRIVEWLPDGSRRLAIAQRDVVLGTAGLLLRYCEPDPLLRRALTERMLAERPGIASFHSTFVDALIELGEIDEAIAYIERVGKLSWEPRATLPAILQLLDARQREARVIASIESQEESNCIPRLQRAFVTGPIRVDPEVSSQHALLADLLERHQFIAIRDFTRDGPMFLEHYLDPRRRMRRSAEQRAHDLAQFLATLGQQVAPDSQE